MTKPGSGAHDIYEIAAGLQRIRDDIGELPVKSQYFAGTPAMFREGKPQLLGVGHTVAGSPDLGIDEYSILVNGFTEEDSYRDIKTGKLVIYFSANGVVKGRPEFYSSLGSISIHSRLGDEGVGVGAMKGDLFSPHNDTIPFPNLTIANLAMPLGGWLVETVEQEAAYREKREEAEEALRNALENKVISVEDYEKEYRRIRIHNTYFPTTADIAPIYELVTDSQSRPFAMDWVTNGVKHVGYDLTSIPTPVTQHK